MSNYMQDVRPITSVTPGLGGREDVGSFVDAGGSGRWVIVKNTLGIYGVMRVNAYGYVHLYLNHAFTEKMDAVKAAQSLHYEWQAAVRQMMRVR